MRVDPGPSERGAGLRVVIASDKFKGALDAPAVCWAIARGVRRVAPEAELDICPMADGGEGTAEALAAGGGRIIEHEVCGPLPGTRVSGRITILEDDETAVLDMATAAGFALLDAADRDPTKTTSYGVGELIRHAEDMGCRKVVVGLGGSATCDGGLGAAQAMGLHVTLDDGPATAPITGGDLIRMRHVDFPILTGRARITCLCDVNNPLFSPNGAAHIFAPQKGATPEQVELLDAGLRHAAEICMRLPMASEPGMGAAGGLAFGLSLSAKVDLRPGADAVADACHLGDRLEATQLCITGEGRFDGQSLHGKAVSGVAHRCLAADVPCVVLAGGVGDDVRDAYDAGVTAAFSIAPGPARLEDLVPRTADLLADSAEQVMRLMLAYVALNERERERSMHAEY